MAGTTIWVSRELKERLDGRKEHPRESYGDLIARLLHESERVRPPRKHRR